MWQIETKSTHPLPIENNNGLSDFIRYWKAVFNFSKEKWQAASPITTQFGLLWSIDLKSSKQSENIIKGALIKTVFKPHLQEGWNKEGCHQGEIEGKRASRRQMIAYVDTLSNGLDHMMMKMLITIFCCCKEPNVSLRHI